MRGSRKHCINPNPGIYRLQNLINGKFYIGASVNLLRRYWQHRQRIKKGKLNSLMLKDNEAYFVFGVVEYCIKNKLKEREQFYIEKWNPHYNKNLLVDDSKKWWTQEDRRNLGEKIKKAWIGRKSKAGFREKHAEARRGILHSEQTKKRLSDMRKGKPKSKEWKEKMRLRRLGTKLIDGKFVKSN